MKLSTHLGLVDGLRFAIQQAFIPTLFAVLHSPILLLHPRALSRLFFSHVWMVYGDGADSASHEIKAALITPNAYGTVLDLGAGHGHTMKYLHNSHVTKYIAVEPNVLMHPYIRAMAAREGFSEDAGTLLILSCGAEDISKIRLHTGGQHKVDTLISILTFCSVPEPEQTISLLVHEILSPGGQLLFHEHVASRKADILWWQKFWSPIWQLCFDGCVLYRPTDQYIQRMEGMWERHTDKDGAGNRAGIWVHEDEQLDDEQLFSHRIGRLVKIRTT